MADGRKRAEDPSFAERIRRARLEIFSDLWSMRDQPKWPQIEAVLVREFGLAWLLWREARGEPLPARLLTTLETDELRSLVGSWERSFLQYLCSHSGGRFITQGAAALHAAYGCPRVPQVVELKSQEDTVEPIVREWCASVNLACRCEPGGGLRVDSGPEGDPRAFFCIRLRRGTGGFGQTHPVFDGIGVATLNEIALRAAQRIGAYCPELGAYGSLESISSFVWICRNRSGQVSPAIWLDIARQLRTCRMSDAECAVRLERDSQIDAQALVREFREILQDLSEEAAGALPQA